MTFRKPEVLELNLLPEGLDACCVRYLTTIDGLQTDFRVAGWPRFMFDRLAQRFSGFSSPRATWEQLVHYRLSVEGLPEGDFKSFRLDSHPAWVNLVGQNPESRTIGIKRHTKILGWLKKPMNPSPPGARNQGGSSQDRHHRKYEQLEETFRAIAKSWASLEDAPDEDAIFETLKEFRLDLIAKFELVCKEIKVSSRLLLVHRLLFLE